MLGMDDFASRLNAAITDFGFSNAKVGESVGLNGETIRNWRKKTPPVVDQFRGIAQMLELTVGYLLAGEEPPPEPDADEAFVLRAVRALGLDADEAVRRLSTEPIATDRATTGTTRGIAVRDLSESSAKRIAESKSVSRRDTQPKPSAPPSSPSTDRGRKKAMK
jgi:hypothetical protein